MNRQNNSNCEPGIFLRRITRLAGATFLLATFAVEAAPLGILVPAYFYPGSLWNSMSNAALRVPLIAIMNPNSGPGASQDPNYIAAVNNLRHTGAQVIGYVSTAYATRLLAQVEADIDSYLSWYTLDGIFLD
jgi:hypothetical protein